MCLQECLLEALVALQGVLLVQEGLVALVDLVRLMMFSVAWGGSLPGLGDFLEVHLDLVGGQEAALVDLLVAGGLEGLQVVVVVGEGDQVGLQLRGSPINLPIRLPIYTPFHQVI